MKRLVWMLSAGSLAGVVVVLLNILEDPGDIAVYKRVAYHSSVAESSLAVPTADSYSVIWEKQEPPTAPEPVHSHEIPGQFILRSVFLVKSSHSAQGFAAIEIRGEEHLYSEGTVLAGGYKLLAVKAGTAVLEKNGRRYTLLLKGTAEPFREPVSIAVPETATVNIAKPEIDEVEPVKFVDPSGMPADKITIAANVWNYAVNNLHKILHNVRVRTDLSGSSGMSGLWIDPNANSLPYKLGFRIGDTIRSIDGKPMKSIKDVMDFYQKALKAPPKRVRIIFERNKKLRVREIHIQI